MSSGLGLRGLARDSSYNLMGQGWALVAGIAISILLARALGPENRGIYAMAVLLPNVLVAFSNLGVAPATVYYVARGEHGLKSAIRTNIALATWASILALTVGTVLVLTAGGVLLPGIPVEYLLFGLLIIPLSLHTSYLISILHGLQDFRARNWVGMTRQVVTLVALVVLVWWLPGGVLGALAAVLAGNLTVLVVLIGLFKKRGYLRGLAALGVDWSQARQLLGYGLRAHLNNIMGFLNYRVDMFLLNLLAGATPVGLYSVSVALAERMWIGSTVVSPVILSRIASMEGDEEERRQLTPLAARHVFWLSLVMGLVVWVLAEWGVVLLFSERFHESATALRVLLPGVVMLSLSMVLGNDIAARGKPSLNSYQSAAALMVNVLANLALIPRLGATGAALATTISYSLLAGLKVVTYCHLTAVSWRKLFLPTSEDLARLRYIVRTVLAGKLP